MTLRRVAIQWDGERGYHVDLPTYSMRTDSWRPITPGLIHADGADPNANPRDVVAAQCTVEIDVPAAYIDPSTGALSTAKIRAMYADHPRFSSDDYIPPAVQPVAEGSLIRLPGF